MTDKEFKKLKRSDLIEIIYKLQKELMSQEEELKLAKTEIEDKKKEIYKLRNEMLEASINQKNSATSEEVVQLRSLLEKYLDEMEKKN